jgi:hypothetical protein
MDELIHEFASEIGDADGHAYTARAMGQQRRGRTAWEGWLRAIASRSDRRAWSR